LPLWGASGQYAKLTRVRASVRATLIGLTTVGVGFASAGVCVAQGMEAVGVRALGMGGAFVAVADDATAAYWNPAGLATGPIVSAVVERTGQGSGEPNAPPFLAAQRGSGIFVGLTLPPVGLTYYRLRSTRLLPPGSTTSGGPVSPDPGVATSLVTQHVGLTLVQSIGPVLDVAGTIKYVHGDAVLGNRDPTFEGSSAVDRVAALASTGGSTVDVDLGALVHVGQFRTGLVARNLRQPSFDAPSHPDALRLDREVRAGVAWRSAESSTTVSCDVDLTRTETELEVRRHVAFGAEHVLHSRLAIRGGFRVNTVNDARTAGSAGVSVAVRSSIWLDAQVTRGVRLADREWGIAARVGF
jgi:hypothetical protein